MHPYAIENVTLEFSLKPFKAMSRDAIRDVCRELFRQWDALIRHADMVSAMLWVADGSEILDYRGSLDDEIEWGRYAGMINPFYDEPDPNDPGNVALHNGILLYMDDPPVITYRWLKLIVDTLKETGSSMIGKPIRVGATFDPGDEFAISTFKYQRHPEICLGGTRGEATFVTCYATLNADDESYAGFPDGIPQDTPLGTFFGRQCQHFLKDLGFDYIWLSNGFGFGLETWATTGVLFDGEAFAPDRANEVRERVVEFWRAFRAECPEYRVETRGTNLSTGIDLAGDATPMADIYRGEFNMMPPPNSPWAAIDGDFGLELVGYMSRIAELPGDKHYPFRFYLHDPWWQNSPWTDRYESQPHDIYLPLAISRIDARGKVEAPAYIEFLTVDNTFGEIPVKYPNEVIPHMLKAREDSPDRVGPIVWVYPFDEYHALTFGAKPRLGEVFFGDWFMRGAVNTGFPLSTVVSSQNLLSSLAAEPNLFDSSVLLAPVPTVNSALERALLDFVAGGGQVLLYGPVAHASEELRHALNLRVVAPISGELELTVDTEGDELSMDRFQTAINHRELMCGGGLNAGLLDGGDPTTQVVATMTGDGETRIAALVRRAPEWGDGALAWVRGTSSNSYRKGQRLLTADDPAVYFRGERLMRWTLAELGYDIKIIKRTVDTRDPVVCVARNRNAYLFSGFCPSTTASLCLRFPQGAPLLVGHETILIHGYSTYALPRAWHHECRVFVEQEQDAQLKCAEVCPSERRNLRRHIRVTGLRKATVRFYPEPGREPRVLLRTPGPDGRLPFNVDVPFQQGEDGTGSFIYLEGFTGDVEFAW
jgi:hypothetical protein